MENIEDTENQECGRVIMWIGEMIICLARYGLDREPAEKRYKQLQKTLRKVYSFFLLSALFILIGFIVLLSIHNPAFMIGMFWFFLAQIIWMALFSVIWHFGDKIL